MRLIHVLQRLSQANAWARQLLQTRKRQAVRPPLPVQLRRAAPLRVGRLEKRIVLDASGVLSAMGELVITSDAAAANETVTIDSGTDGELQITQLGAPLEIVDELGAPVTSLADVESIDVSLGAGQDLLIVDFSGASNPASIPSITYHGGSTSDPSGADVDRLKVIGDGSLSAIYSLGTLSPADGSIQVTDAASSSTSITFTGLQPIEVTGMASTLLRSDGSGTGDASTVQITGEFDLAGDGSTAELNVHAGATLSGTGTVRAADVVADVNLQTGSTLSPGNSPGVLTIANANFVSGSTFDVEIDDHNGNDPLATPTGGEAGVDYDQLQVQGTVTIGTNVVLNLQDLGSTEANARDVYTIIDNDGVDAVVGHFVDTSNVVLRNGDTITATAGLQYRIDYNGGDGNDVVLIGIPASRTEVFVSNDFNQTPGNLIADVDFNTAGSQAGIYGIDAFATLEEAIQNVDLGGTVFVDEGIFVHSGTLLIDRSVTIEGQGMGLTEVRRAGAPAGSSAEAIRITADNVTLRGMQLGWVDFLANDYQGYVVLTTGDHTTINQVQFGESFGGDPLDDDGYRSAIVFETADHLEVSDSVFEGRWGRAAIRDGADGSGQHFLITRNEFREVHFRWGPIAIGPQGTFGDPNDFAFSGEISFNYFGNGLDPVDFQSSGDQNYTVTITNQGLTADGLVVDHNTFDWNDTNTQNQNGVYARPAGVFITPSFTTNTDQIIIQDNIFNGFAYGGLQPQAEQPTWQPGAGVFGGALYLDGDGDFGVVQDSRIDIGDSGSLTVWIKADELGRRQQIAGGPIEMQVRHSDDVYFYPGESATLIWSSDQIALNTWTHVAFTWDHATQQGQIYFDGVEVAYRSGYDSDVSPSWTQIVDTMQQILIGRDPGNPGARDFHGAMDDLAFFDGMLTQTDVQGVMTNGAAFFSADPRLVAHWDFDQAAGKTAIDNQQGIEMRLATDGIMPFGPEFVAGGGQFGGALRFDGADDFATFQDPTFDVGATGTLNFWVEMDDTSRRNQFFEGPDNAGLEMQYRNNSGGQVYGRTSTNGDYVIRSGGDAALLNSGWHNIQYTWDFTSSEMHVFVDGAESTHLSSYTPDNLSWSSVADTINGLMFMGRDASSSGRFFDGMMDDVAWYDSVLSTTELQALRNDGVTAHADLVAHWSFDTAPSSANTYAGDSGTSIMLYLQQLPPAPPIEGSGVVTPAAAVVRNNAFFANDVDSNQVLDSSNITGDKADPFFNGDQPGTTPLTLAEYYTLRFGSSAAYQSTQFQADITTSISHIGAYQGDPIAVGIEDMLIVGTDEDDLLVVTFDGESSGSFVLTTAVGTVNETTLGPIAFAEITSITFNGYDGDDVLKIIQPDSGGIYVSDGIFFNAGGQTIDGDTLILEAAPAQTTIDSVHYFFEDEGAVGHVGSIMITDATNNGGLGGSTTIFYDGLEPIYDSLNVDDRSFTFNSTAAAETITLSSPGDPVGPLPTPLDNKIRSDNAGVPLSEVVHFNNPNVSMTIHAGDGDQIVNVDSLDANYRAALTINGGDGAADVVNFNTSLGSLLLGAGSVTGTLAVTAETILIHADVSIDTTGGDVDGTVTLLAVDGITMHDTATIAAGDADLRMNAQGDIAISRITSAQTAAVTTTGGRIIDNRSSDEAANITAVSTALRADIGIGSGTAPDDADLDLNVSNLAAVTATGDIHLQNAKELIVQAVDGLTGIAITDPLDNNAADTITIRTAGAFQVAAGNLVSNHSGGDTLLAAEGTGAGDTLTIDAAVSATGGSGEIYLFAGDSIAVAAVAISATQAGAVLLSAGTNFNNGSPIAGNAAADISLASNATVQSTTGNISLLAPDSISLGSGASVQTDDAGTIDVSAATGSFQMAPTAALSSDSGDIRVQAGNALDDVLVVGDLVAATANVSLISSGAILDADSAAAGDDSDDDVTARSLRMVAGLGIGLLSGNSRSEVVNALETNINTVSAVSGGDGISIVEADAILVGDTSTTVQRVGLRTTTSIFDASQSDLVTTTGNGSIVLRTLAGDITLDDGTAAGEGNAVVAQGSGNVLIAAEGTGTDIVANASVLSSSGNISLLAARHIQLSGNVDVQTVSNGTIDLEAINGSLTMDATATLQSVEGDIRAVANTNVTIGDIVASAADVSLTSRTGSILDADPNDSDLDVTALRLRLNAATGVGILGAGSNAIETSVDVVSARATDGGINVIESNGVTVGDVDVTIERVLTNGSQTPIADVTQSDLVTTVGNGSIVLRTLAGDITLDDGTAAGDGNAVVAHGSGNVLIAAEGTGTDIVANASVLSSSGNISLLAARHIQLSGYVDVQTASMGSIDLEAINGALTMDATATLQSVEGDIRAVANTNVTIGDIIASAADVSLTSHTASILDADPNDNDLDVTTLRLRLNAATGVGILGAGSNAIETNVDVVSARATDGGINLIESNGVTVGDVDVTIERVLADASQTSITDVTQSDLVTTAGNGSIVLRTLAGDITLDDGTAGANGNAVVAHGSGNVLLQTNSTTGDIVVNADVRSGTGHVSIVAVDDILQNADVVTGDVGTLLLTSGNANDDGVGNDGIVMQSVAQTVSGGGNIRLQATGESDLLLGLIDAGTGDVSLIADRNVLDNNGATLMNVRSDALRIVADANDDLSGTIGTSDLGNSPNSNDHAIQTAVATLAAVSADGIYILESDAIAIDHSLDISVEQVGGDALVTTITDDSLSDLETTDAGPIKVVTLAGTITVRQGDTDDSGVRAAGDGGILLESRGNASDVVIEADVSSLSGHVSFVAADDISLAADLSTGGAGTIWMQAGNAFSETPTIDGIQMLTGSSITSGGDISIETLGESDLVVHSIDAGANTVRLSADGNIVDGNGAAVNVTARSLIMIADANEDGVGSIGSPDPSSLPDTNLKAIDIEVERVATRSADGIYLQQLRGDLIVDSVTVDVNRVHFNSTTTEISQTLADLETTDSGSIKVVVVDGDLTLNDGDGDTIAVWAADGGDVLLDARGTGNLLVNASVLSGSGQIGLQAQESIELANSIVVETGETGTIVIDAGLSAGATGGVTMGTDTLVQTDNGDIHIAADENVVVGRIVTLGNVSLTSTAASILDADANDAAIDIRAAGLRLNAFNGVGGLGATANALETQIATLSGRSGSGGFNVVEADAVRIDDVTVQTLRPNFNSTRTSITDATQSDLRTVAGGSIVLRTLAGNITLNDGTAAADGNAIVAHGSGNVLIAAEGTNTDIVANADVRSTAGNISVLTARNVLLNANVDIRTAATGTIDVEAISGSLTMDATSTLQSVSGDIRAVANNNVMIGDIIASAADVSLISRTASILDADSNDSAVDVTALRLRMNAAVGIGILGAGTNGIETSVDVVSARATSGGINLIEANGVAVGDVDVAIQRVLANSLVTTVVDATQSDLVTTSGNGDIVLRTLAGNITLNNGTAAADGNAVVAHGSGNVLISAEGADTDIVADADVRSASGNISVLAARNVQFRANVDVQTASTGTIDVEAISGSLTMDATSTLQSAAGDIRAVANNNVTIGAIIATDADVSLISHAASIVDADVNDNDLDVIAQRLRLNAAVGIGILGAGTNGIETSVDVVSARATSGGINLIESNGVTVGDVDVAIQRVIVNSLQTTVVDATQSDLVTTAGNGSIVLRTLAGNITLNDGTAAADGNAVVTHGSGNVLVAAEGADTDIVANANVRSTTGNISVLAARNVLLNANVDIRTAATGTIDVEAISGSLTMNATATLQSAAGDVRAVANNNVMIGDIIASAADVSLTSRTGSILDADPNDSDLDVTALRLRMNAAVGIGTLGAGSNGIETSVDVVSARATSGGINLIEFNGVTVGDVDVAIQRVLANSLQTTVVDATQSDLVTTAGNGSIVLRTLAGNITLNDGTAAADGNAIVAHGSGNVLIAAEGANTDIIANAAVRSTAGNISVLAARNVQLNANVDIRTASTGTIDVEAISGSLTMDATSTLQSVAGDIRAVANHNVTIGDIIASAADVSLTSRTGSILDADPNDSDLDVTALRLRMNAADGIGMLGAGSNGIETSVDVVSAQATIGGINLIEADGVTVADVDVAIQRVLSNSLQTTIVDATQNDLVTTAGNGSIVLRTMAGKITLDDGTAAADGNAVVAHGSGNVLLQTNSTTGDIVVNADVRSGTGHISIVAVDDILQNADLITSGTGTLSLNSDNANDDGVGNDGIVMQSAAQTVSGGGNIRLQATGESDLLLGLIDAGTGDVSLIADRNVLDNNGATLMNVRSDALRIVADANDDLSGTIGTSDLGNSPNSNDHAIQTAVATLAAVSADGIYILESDAIVIDHSMDISVEQVGVNALVTTLTDDSLSDLETTDSGPVKVVTLAGTITIRQGDADDSGVRAAGDGDILLESRGSASDVVIEADVSSLSGHVSFVAADDISLAADLSTGGAGTIWMQAGNAFLETPTVDGIQMLAGSSIASGGDISIEVLGESDLVVQSIDAGTNTVRLSADGNIVDGNGAALNITAGSLMLIADANEDGVGSIGSPDPSSLANTNLKAIDIEVERVAARSADGIYLQQLSGDLIVDSVTVDVNRVHFNSTTTGISQTLADLETTDSGSIKVVVVDGDLTLNDGDGDTIAVWAADGGDVLLDASGTGNLLVNASVLSDRGQLGLQAQDSIELANTVVVQTGGDGTVVIDAGLSAGTTGAFTMAAEARVQTANGDIHIAADQNVVVGRIATAANVSLSSTAASILDADSDDSTIDVTASGLRLNALVGVGVLRAAANGLETQIATLSARAGSGGIHVVETDGLRVGDVSVDVLRPDFRSTQTAVRDLAQSDLRTTAGGSIVLRSLAGEIILDEGTASASDGSVFADGLGNILIAAEGPGSRITANADITSDVGNISVLASGSIAVNADVTVVTAATGTIDLEATTGTLAMATTATLKSTAGDIRAAAGDDLTIGDIVATDADVSLISTGGSILDADSDDTDIDVTANRLRMSAAIGIGTATNAIETTVDTLSGRATSGGIHLLESDGIVIDDVVVSIERVGINAISATRTDLLQSDLRTSGGNGSIMLNTIDGSITLNEGTAAAGDGAISANGSGVVQITAGSDGSDVVANADITSGSGAIKINAARNISLVDAVDVTTTGVGTIDLNAIAGSLTMAPTATLQSVSGNITGTAEQDVTIGDIRSTKANVILTSKSSRIIDADPAGDTDQDIAAVEAILSAPLGVGDGNAIETAVEILDAEVALSGAIEIAEADAIELRQVLAGDGHITVVAGGTITATDVQSTNTSSSDAALGVVGSHDIALVANSAASSILVTKITAAAGADVHLTADNDILDTNFADDQLIRADDLHLRAGNQTEDGNNAVRLMTTVNDLQAQVGGSGRGDLEIRETDALNLVTSDEATDADVLQTANGEIRITAGGSIVLQDSDSSNDGGDRLADPEIMAGGANGRILLEAGDDLTIGDGVQIHASQSTAGAVRIAAQGDIFLGEEIEINTGTSTGVARVFAPRPEEGVTDTAFFDYDTVATTTLASEPGGFGGDLIIDVGTQGERGLAVEIDWGAESNRFQLVPGIDGDAPLLVVHHVYSEQEILTTMLNGRTSSTGPIEVRFAVRQHESIVIEGASVEQGISGVQSVAGGLVSSTDNPNTVPLPENGEAQFLVPNLSIPTRLFFPPPEYPELVRRVSEPFVETSTLLKSTSVASESVAVTTMASRDEYFQIRVISPDPNVESLVPPERLPDDILSGDKLQELFSKLPDGTYEVEYVLGEGNARSILRVEIRQGKPIIPGEDLEGGLLRLKELELGPYQTTPQSDPPAPRDLESTQNTAPADDSFTPAEWQQPGEVLATTAGTALLSWKLQQRTRPAGGEFSLTRRIARRFAK